MATVLVGEGRVRFCANQTRNELGKLMCGELGIACPYINSEHARLGVDGRGDASCDLLKEIPPSPQHAPRGDNGELCCPEE